MVFLLCLYELYLSINLNFNIIGITLKTSDFVKTGRHIVTFFMLATVKKYNEDDPEHYIHHAINIYLKLNSNTWHMYYISMTYNKFLSGFFYFMIHIKRSSVVVLQR